MLQSNLLELTYFDPKASVRLTTYADTIITEPCGREESIIAARFGGYPEMVRAMSDAIYGGGIIDLIQNGTTYQLKSTPKAYLRHLSHDGSYATATLMITDETLSADSEDDDDKEDASSLQSELSRSRKCYIFCPDGDRESLFAEVDRKTSVPLLTDFQDYVLDELIARKILRRLKVFALHEKLDAWLLELLPNDQNIVDVLEQGLKNGNISIPGTDPGHSDGFDGVTGVTSYLNTFGTDLAKRIRNQFVPLFDPASEPLSEEVLAINDYIQKQAGYSLYDAQLAVAETVKRQLEYRNTAFIVAECGTGKTKIGSTALGAVHGLLAAQRRKGCRKTFNLVMCPSHVTRKWVREIGETLPDTYAMVVRSITEFDRLYAMYEAGDKNVFAVFSKERARDGYMRYPIVTLKRHQKKWYFVCPSCGKPILQERSDDGTIYFDYADQFYFQKESRQNCICSECGSPLWGPVVPGRNIPWTKITNFGWVYKERAQAYLTRSRSAAVQNQLEQIIADPQGMFPVAGAVRRFPLSTYIKKKYRGRIDGFLCDELHEYNNKSGQGDAMAELFGVSKQFVGMTATLINGYSSGIFHLLYRAVPGLMKKDGKSYRRPSDFDAEYGVVESTFETTDAEYNSKRRTSRQKTQTRQLPGVSPLVFSRFLLEYTAFLSLSDMGKDLPDYEEIPVPLEMPEAVGSAYKYVETTFLRALKTDRKAAKKLMSAYMNLLTVYPDQPYDHPAIIHPFSGETLVRPQNAASYADILPKEKKALEIVQAKIAAGERVLIYTSWTRTDSQKKLLDLLNREGIRTDILTPSVSPEKREAWVVKRVRSGLQVLITNPRCVETGLDLNDFTTLIFYSMGYNLFTLRQASRRSWRINQTAPRVEVYMLYYMETIQAKAMKLMASKLAVAGLIEGSFSEEGLAAMSDVRDMTSQMAKELAQGIKDSVEDIAATFKKMAIINPDRESRQAPALPIPELEPVAETEDSVLRAADSQRNRTLYDGLLEQSILENRRQKLRQELEDQLSIFGFAA